MDGSHKLLNATNWNSVIELCTTGMPLPGVGGTPVPNQQKHHLVLVATKSAAAIIDALADMEVWMLNLENDHAVWDFPCQPPTDKPVIGECGLHIGRPVTAVLAYWKRCSALVESGIRPRVGPVRQDPIARAREQGVVAAMNHFNRRIAGCFRGGPY